MSAMVEISNADYEFLKMVLAPMGRKVKRTATTNSETNHAERMIQIAKKWNRRK